MGPSSAGMLDGEAVDLRSTDSRGRLSPHRFGRGLSTPLRMTSGLIAFVAGALPRNQFADGGARARNRLLVGFYFGARSFVSDGANAEPDFLFFGTHFDDLELALDAGFQMQRLTVPVNRF